MSHIKPPNFTGKDTKQSHHKKIKTPKPKVIQKKSLTL